MSAEIVLDTARKAGLKIATAESCTGGMISAALTAIAGSSDVFDRGFVTYSNQAKQDMLGVMDKTLTAHGAVSEQVALEMAQGAIARSNAQIGVSVTGIAGPGGSEFKPEGRVCFGCVMRNGYSRVETMEFGAIGRETVRHATVEHALTLLITALKTTNP